eukprot:scaffold45460_cov67-Phaeocystis_antarctica.AAC.9
MPLVDTLTTRDAKGRQHGGAATSAAAATAVAAAAAAAASAKVVAGGGQRQGGTRHTTDDAEVPSSATDEALTARVGCWVAATPLPSLQSEG